MVTKAIIKNKIVDSNKYLIEIPYLSQSSVSNNGITNSVLEATLSHTPGIVNSYDEGDVVFITFEDDKKDKPIIIGKLLLENVSNRGYANFSSLNISNSARLSENTIIGDFNFKDMRGTLEKIEFNINSLEDIKEEIINEIKEMLPKIIDLRV